MAPKKFLCCFSLKTGSEIIAFLCVIVTSLSLYGLILCIKQIKSSFNTYIPEVKEFDPFVSLYTALNDPGEIVICLIIVQSTYLLFSIMLAIGLYKNNPCWMVPWIFFEPIRQLLLLIFAVICTWAPFVIFNLYVSGKEIVNFVPIAAAVIALILTALSLHFWTIVNAVWDQMKEDQTIQIFANDQSCYLEKNANYATLKEPMTLEIMAQQ